MRRAGFLLQRSDFVSIHVTRNPEPHHLIGEQELQLMKSSGILINTARGSIVDQAALYQALQDGVIADFKMTADERYELYLAGWLHDCGKVATPPHVVDKGMKLETITDRIETVDVRFEVLKRDAEIDICLLYTSDAADE